MGNITISTTNTIIYYPSDWLIEGGPPFESMACPKYQENTDVQPLEIIYNPETQYFGITQGDFIVMESKEPRDLSKYIKDYVEGFQGWLAEQEAINAEADADVD